MAKEYVVIFLSDGRIVGVSYGEDKPGPVCEQSDLISLLRRPDSGLEEPAVVLGAGG